MSSRCWGLMVLGVAVLGFAVMRYALQEITLLKRFLGAGAHAGLLPVTVRLVPGPLLWGEARAGSTAPAVGRSMSCGPRDGWGRARAGR